MTIARTILDQLGGNKFIAMTGSKNFTDCGRSLSMRLAKNASRANYLKITLNGLDTYDMEFAQYLPGKYNAKSNTFRSEQIISVAKFDGVYCDQLQGIFTGVTKLYTRL